MEKTFGLIGGDRRQAELSRLLAADGNTVHTYGLDAWKPVGAGSLDRTAGADVIVLPLPLCRMKSVSRTGIPSPSSPNTAREPLV